jgi:hypothetical protein
MGLTQLSEEELREIIGNAEPDMDGQFPGFEDQIACGLPNFNSGSTQNNSSNTNNSNTNNSTNGGNYNPYWDWALQAWRINWMRYHCPNGFFVE